MNCSNSFADLVQCVSAYYHYYIAIFYTQTNLLLGHLRPSRELLEYYRKKIAEYDGEHEEMMTKLDQYKMTYEEQVHNSYRRGIPL